MPFSFVSMRIETYREGDLILMLRCLEFASQMQWLVMNARGMLFEIQDYYCHGLTIDQSVTIIILNFNHRSSCICLCKCICLAKLSFQFFKENICLGLVLVQSRTDIFLKNLELKKKKLKKIELNRRATEEEDEEADEEEEDNLKF